MEVRARSGDGADLASNETDMATQANIGNLLSGSILVVDDQPANLRAVSALLSRHGYDVRTANNGEEALALAVSAVPDLLLLDMMMPGMDGFDLLLRMQAEPPLAMLPAIFLTAAFTGLRRGELLGLRWRDVDFAGSTIRVRASYAAGKLTTPKSGKVRAVPMAPDVASALAKLGDRVDQP